MPSATAKPTLRRVPAISSPEEILKIVSEDGGVILEDFLTPAQVESWNAELDPALAKLAPGYEVPDNVERAAFHGDNTKRLTNIVTHSKTFREQLLDKDSVHEIAARVFEQESGSYWLGAAQVIEIGPGNPAQPLHRDLENHHPFVTMGSAGPEVALNFLIALSDFTEGNGATHVIPGSHKWPDFNDRGNQDMTIPAEMRKGDCLLINGKVCHGGGHNQSTDFYRRACAFTFQPGFLTPEEAYPFMVDMKMVKTMSRRAQQMVGFRSVYPKGSPGLWCIDVKELGAQIGLE